MTPRSPPPIWSQNGTILRGYQNGADVDGGLTFPVSFPGVITKPQIVNLASSALANGTFDILDNVRFYLTGDADDIELVQKTWPNLGFAYNPPRPELNGGFRSFDGINWTTFAIRDPTLTGSVGAGDQNDPTTWILLPGSAMGGNGQDGTLGPGLFLAATYICSRARARPPGPSRAGAAARNSPPARAGSQPLLIPALSPLLTLAENSSPDSATVRR